MQRLKIVYRDFYKFYKWQPVVKTSADLYSKDAQTLLLSLGLYIRSPKQVTAENKIK